MDTPFVVTGWWALTFTAGAMALLVLIAHVLVTSQQPKADTVGVAERRQRGVKALIVGKDGRASTSRTQLVLWTGAVLFAFFFMLIWGRSVGCGDKDNEGERVCIEAAEGRESFDLAIAQPLQVEYYVLLGLPAATAVAAMALTKNKVQSGELTKPDAETAGVTQGLSELVSSDSGETDLVDFQYLAFNLVTLLWFAFEFASEPSAGLPALPPTLIGLSGVAAATYTTKKAIARDSRAAISSVVPSRAPKVKDTALRLYGSGFGEPAAAGASGAAPVLPEVTLNGVALKTTHISDGELSAVVSEAAVKKLPAAAAATDPVSGQVVVIPVGGLPSDPAAVEFYAPGS